MTSPILKWGLSISLVFASSLHVVTAQDKQAWDPVLLAKRIYALGSFVVIGEILPPFAFPTSVALRETPNNPSGARAAVTFRMPKGTSRQAVVMFVYDTSSAALRGAQAMTAKEEGFAGNPETYRSSFDDGYEFLCSHYPVSQQVPPKTLQCVEWRVSGQASSQVVVVAITEGAELRDAATAARLKEAAKGVAHLGRGTVMFAEADLFKERGLPEPGRTAPR